MNNNRDCEHCRNKCCEQYIEKEEFPVLKSIINWSKLGLKHILKFGSKWLMVAVGIIVIFILYDLFFFCWGTSFDTDNHSTSGSEIISEENASSVVSEEVDVGDTEYLDRLLIFLLLMYMVMTLYSAWSKIREAHLKLEELKETAIEEKSPDSIIKRKLQRFEFYTTAAFYIRVLENTAPMIIIIMVVCVATSSGSIDVSNILEMIYYVGIVFLYWLLMWVTVLTFAICFYPYISVRDCILLSPTYKKYKIEEILDEIKKKNN